MTKFSASKTEACQVELDISSNTSLPMAQTLPLILTESKVHLRNA